MGTRTITVCDRCGKEGAMPRLFVVTDRVCDPAGSMDDQGENIDLCQKCLEAAVTHFILAGRDYEANRAFLNWATAGKRKP